MQKFIEMRWHGRAGQGVVTAADMIAQVLAKKGKCVQAFPEFGAEKRGAPVLAFNRISDEPILLHSRVKNPEIVAVLDPTLIGIVNITEGITSGAKILVNTTKEPKLIKEKLSLKDNKVFVVDAYKISNEEIGRPIPNMPMLGALIKATGMFELDDFVSTIQGLLGKKFNEKIVEGNKRAIKRSYEEVISSE